MRLLLDTHVVLWWLADDPALPEDLAAILEIEPEIYISAATVWEVGIKQALGKLDGPADLPELVRDSEFHVLSITANHAIEAARLPLIHRDPFDRILIAQAKHEGLRLVTRDSVIPRYDVPLLGV
ncbi:type II toxin-antitoxin system VapC family toxin [Nocardia panacis]|uniref:Type II toxin-antitoxin system VapC family toxin n=1 Tax=Nocardia panacis TaxID=2340916 RepID=A0A3A4KAU0_9NOCA|nr:type II toxin-antitoxin system VapC family toxin [Nocardia panacis]RJO72188.1 type II toxin-antitoxin system VapC family toxin [Nocardia panacis]